MSDPTNSLSREGDIFIRSLSSVEASHVLPLLSGSLSKEGATRKTMAFWKWKHVDNPFGGSIGLCAYSKSTRRLVSIRPLMLWKFKLSDRTVVNGLRPVDTVTHPDWRGKGLFSELTKAAIENVNSNSFSLLFNTPNANSFPGYIRLGWSLKKELPIYVKVKDRKSVV